MAGVPEMFLSGGLLGKAITAICEQYETTAPTVAAWANGVYVRMTEKQPVDLAELNALQSLFFGDQWEQPNYAANRIYKLQERLGQDTTGQAGF